MTRPYNQTRRAEHADQTRRRITEAAVALHGSVGPARTTISAIASAAGVERLTVYRHFADDRAIFEACSAHWLAGHPPPDPTQWAALRGAAALTAALTALHAYYARTSGMWRLIYRDAPVVPAMAPAFSRWGAYLETVEAGLVAAIDPPSIALRRRAGAAIGHAIDFATWQSLTSRGLGPRALVSLLVGWIEGASRPAPGPGRRQAQRPPRGAGSAS